jgi:hypothetical protein
MEIQFYRDPESDLPHCLDHGVAEQEVMELFSNAPLRLQGRGDSYLALGQTDSGRYLKVIYRIEDDAVFVITAYDLRGRALASYKRRLRRKGGR